MRLDLTDLRLFLHVAETGSITHGAARSNLALASASERIRDMESDAGAPLLLRGRRGVSLTPAGRSLVHHAMLVLQQIDTMKAELGTYAGGAKGHVRLLANSAALSEFLPEMLGAFLVEHPGIDVDVEERPSYDIVRAVAEGFVEIGIVADIVDFAGLETFPFAIDRLVVVTPRHHAVAGRRSVAFRDLLDHDFVGLTPNNALQQHLGQHAMQAGRPLKLRVRVGSFDAVCRMVERNVGLAVIPGTAARRCRASMAIRIVRLTDGWAQRRLHVCVRQVQALAGPARRLVEHLMQQAAVRPQAAYVSRRNR